MAISGYFSLGNVFSGKASMHQSPSTELIISNTSWFALWHCTLLWFGYVPAMRSLRFVNITGGRPTIRYCLRRLAADLYGYAALMLVLEMLGLPIIGGYVHLSRVRNLRTMCIIVGLPTVLIDTQTRILLLGQQNSGFTAASTIGMTFVEITSRTLKAAMAGKCRTPSFEYKPRPELRALASKMPRLSHSRTASGHVCGVHRYQLLGFCAILSRRKCTLFPPRIATKGRY
ncbi:hypothetical protein JG687_00009295 [Phytophthora cactorum]|uniref:Uncharacterized protein n=1 Tax=Phytophthora cactorum TaxID=29920 RepID=A0A8T1UCJ3_9STRA|nr:hypothetical protein JG687_00009295 [Phytophthora cactorum]